MNTPPVQIAFHVYNTAGVLGNSLSKPLSLYFSDTQSKFRSEWKFILITILDFSKLVPCTTRSLELFSSYVLSLVTCSRSQM